jgi:hypothetical protein
MASRALRRSLPVPAMVVVLVVALATMGVAYGLWSETLTIRGTVHTGEVAARWIFASCAEFYPWPGGGHAGEVEGKDVGVTTAEIDPDDPRILRITVTNGYPSYAVDCEVHFIIEGTVPVHEVATSVLPLTNLTGCTLTGGQTKTLACDQMTIKFFDGVGLQLHPGDEQASSLMFHVEQPAGENTTYEFEVGICFAQWNEQVSADQCFAASPP